MSFVQEFSSVITKPVCMQFFCLTHKKANLQMHAYVQKRVDIGRLVVEKHSYRNMKNLCSFQYRSSACRVNFNLFVHVWWYHHWELCRGETASRLQLVIQSCSYGKKMIAFAKRFWRKSVCVAHLFKPSLYKLVAPPEATSVSLAFAVFWKVVCLTTALSASVFIATEESRKWNAYSILTEQLHIKCGQACMLDMLMCLSICGVPSIASLWSYVYHVTLVN